jgi:hypothetical protein
VIRDVVRPAVGLPLLSIAGVNFARRCRIRHVVESRVRDPLDPVTLQAETRPSVPIDKATDTVPDSSLSIACAG